ncbi:mitochondrial aldehyde dehydrogenase [Exophiala xenobiotica]|nr:mitochondrial aldehyde dehydrogenase [Exophiala xenobiotica]KAK5551107.1 mitochondrial aldehyde dehydrogenase [Exophiala xenobiotica]
MPAFMQVWSIFLPAYATSRARRWSSIQTSLLISFTGSTATARKILKQAAGTRKHVTLEAGGKSPALVFADVDLEQAICSATSRIFVQDTIYDKFIEAFKKTVNSTSIVGDPLKDDTYQGPQVTRSQFEKVLAYIEAEKREGATLESSGEAIKVN